MIIRPSVVLVAVLTSALALGMALTARAQRSPMPQQPPAQQPQFTQNQLESFASAVLDVQEIRAKWQPQLQAADNPEKIKEVQEQATGEMVSAVEGKGLTVETYNAITRAAQADPELAGRIAQLMKKAR